MTKIKTKTETTEPLPRLDSAATRHLGLDSSDIAVLGNSSSPAMRRAFAELPGWAAAVTRVNTVAAATREFWAAFPRHDLAAEVVAMADTGSCDVDRLRAMAEAAGVCTATASHATAAFEAALRSTGDQLRSAADPDALRASLHSQLLEVIEAVRKLPPSTRALRTAEDAIAADDVAGWREMDRLHRAYRDIRASASLINSKDTTLAGLSDPMAALIANPLEIWPGYAFDRSNVQMRDSHGRKAIIRPPWPHAHSELPGQRRDETDSVEFLVWLVSSEADPWVPSADQYAKACAQVNAAVVKARSSDEAERAAVVESNGGAAA